MQWWQVRYRNSEVAITYSVVINRKQGEVYVGECAVVERAASKPNIQSARVSHTVVPRTSTVTSKADTSNSAGSINSHFTALAIPMKSVVLSVKKNN